eukprot:IDg10346t1
MQMIAKDIPEPAPSETPPEVAIRPVLLRFHPKQKIKKSPTIQPPAITIPPAEKPAVVLPSDACRHHDPRRGCNSKKISLHGDHARRTSLNVATRPCHIDKSPDPIRIGTKDTAVKDPDHLSSKVVVMIDMHIINLAETLEDRSLSTYMKNEDYNDVQQLLVADSRKFLALRPSEEEQKILRMCSGELGEITELQHSIDLLPGTLSIRQQSYRSGLKSRKEVKEHVDKMLRKGVIVPSISEWTSPVVLAPERNGSMRFCIEFQHIPEVQSDQDGTAFVTFDGLYEFVRMPFVYIDDVIIFSKDINEHIGHVDEVLGALQAAEITLNLGKCESFAHSVTYLGHMARPGELAVAEACTRSLKRTKQPTNITEL